MKSLLLFVVVVGCCVLQSCRTSTMISVPVLHPSEINTNGYTRVYVSEFADSDRLRRDGEHIRAMVEEELLYGKKIEVISSPLGKMPLVDSATLVLSGSVTDYSYAEKFSEQQCILPRKVWYRDSLKKWRDSTVRDSIVIDYTRSGTLHLAVQFKVTNAVTGAIVGVRTIDDIIPITFTARNATPAPINPGLYDTQIRRSVVQNFLAKIFPYRVYEGVELLIDGDLPELERGNRFAARGDWDYAIAEYRNAVANHKGHEEIHKAYFNMGCAFMYTCFFPKAIENLNEAMRLAPDEEKYVAAHSHARYLERQYAQLQEPAKK
ncbi:MAG: tetratricopeptide repeat protein [Candidatus Kapaibacterium sp.]|nr:tetratricopeptide repeat protein [Bacteroidota bacterium]